MSELTSDETFSEEEKQDPEGGVGMPYTAKCRILSQSPQQLAARWAGRAKKRR